MLVCFESFLYCFFQFFLSNDVLLLELSIVSGEVPREPVVSKTSGIIFEKALIEKHISTYGTCPVTQSTLQVDDLLPIKGLVLIFLSFFFSKLLFFTPLGERIVKPRVTANLSIPGLLSSLQVSFMILILLYKCAKFTCSYLCRNISIE